MQKSLPTNICHSFVSGVIIFYRHISHLVDFDTADMVSFNIKYFFSIEESFTRIYN